MSVPSVVKGQYWNVAVCIDGSGTNFVTICGLNSRNLTEQYQTNDQTLRDCNDPTQVPFRTTNVTSVQFDIAGTGLYNRAQGDLIRQLGGQSLPYRFILGEDASDVVDAGYYSGNFVLTNKQLGAADGSNVTSQFTWASDGVVKWTPGADIIVLDPLTLGTRAAVHGTAWTSVINGRTVGSTITATSSDSTALTVSGNNVSGNFTAAGQPIITLNEALASASNTPRVSTTNINVT